MNENTGQFRSAAFGGFHRQDVLDYLERITRENQTQKQALEQALAEEQAARAQAEARAQQAENKAAEAVADREAFEQTLAESRQAQEKITAALAEAEAQVAALREKEMCIRDRARLPRQPARHESPASSPPLSGSADPGGIGGSDETVHSRMGWPVRIGMVSLSAPGNLRPPIPPGRAWHGE